MDEILSQRSSFAGIPSRDFIDPTLARQAHNTAIEAHVQRELISSVIDGRPTAPTANEDRNSSYPFWSAKAIRYLDLQSVPAKYHAQKFSQVEYLFRHHPMANWIWETDRAAALVREIVEPYTRIFSRMTRIKIHLQKPGQRVIFHRDLSAGRVFKLQNPLSTSLGTEDHTYQMYPWVDLKDFPLTHLKSNESLAYSLKIPLSLDTANYGRQTILDQKPYYYSTSGNLYLLNESNFHGAETVPHVRGMVFIDGIIDLEAAFKTFPDPVPASDYDFITG